MLPHTHLAQLLPLFERERAMQRSMVLATLVHTQGSTYRKAGAQMLIAQDGDYAGLLSGGCLEGDLREHAHDVLRTRQARLVRYDLRNDDALFGLGAGCAGAMDILLQIVDAQNDWQPIAQLQQSWQANEYARLGLVVVSAVASLPAGSVLQAGNLDEHALSAPNTLMTRSDGTQMFMLCGPPPPRLLILGAGPDAQPLAQLCHFLGWKATVYDHRPMYATAARFAHAEQVIVARPEHLQKSLVLNEYQAVVVMSHHLESDLHYLQQLATCAVPYLGLLGPAQRRERLFAVLATTLGTEYPALRERLHAPVGLAIGANSPEAIALAIIGEIHARLALG